MAHFGSEQADTVLAACQVGAQDASVALSRCLDGGMEIAPRDAFGSLSDGALPEAMSGPGLVVRLQMGDELALILIPAAGGLSADWLATPDEVGHTKLKVLAEELGIALLPEEFTAEASLATYARDMGSICQSLELDPQASYVPFRDAANPDGDDVLWLVWPAKGWTQSSPTQQDAPVETAHERPRRKLHFNDLDDGIRQLPGYARHLLKIPMAATVTLASTKMQVGHIEELGPGSIIQFNKSCEDTLTLEVGGCEVAEGEAVKVGEKFGFWVTSIVMPEERFESIKGRRQS